MKEFIVLYLKLYIYIYIYTYCGVKFLGPLAPNEVMLSV
jgi:hypothetical protein